MVKMRAGELIDMYQALERIAQQKVPARAAYWVSRLMVKLRPEFEAFDAQHNAMAIKHGKDMGNGQFKVQPGESMQAFLAEYQPVAETEIEVDVQPIKIEVFGEAELAPADLMCIDKLIEA